MTDVGSAAEEAVKLLTAAEQWARTRAAHLLDDEHLSTGSVPCTTCPLCQAVGAVRHVRPETVEHLLDAAASLAAALRGALAPPPGPRPSGSPVEHIDVREG
ncbi:MAG: hypothetical protein JWM64_1143 [Frankiales bacterium]|nr:hypothetical protein [Frankiales bacterium]